MTPRDKRITGGPRQHADVEVHATPKEAQRQLAGIDQHEVRVARWCAPAATMAVVARYESAHAWQAFHSGWEILRLALREDATGVCTIAGSSHDYDTSVRKITFQLAGVASDLREPFAFEVPLNFDIIAARMKIDALNEGGVGPALSYEQAAALAVTFVDDHVQAIQNISVALLDAREMDHLGVRVFGRCGA